MRQDSIVEGTGYLFGKMIKLRIVEVVVLLRKSRMLVMIQTEIVVGGGLARVVIYDGVRISVTLIRLDLTVKDDWNL